MLKLPSFQYYDDLRTTIYQDDTQFWKFYMLPDHVSLRKDQADKPVFMLTKYAFSDEDRENDPSLPPGGGLMNFDVELRVPQGDMDILRDRLQVYVDGEWSRLKSLAEAENVPVESMTLPSWHNRTNGVPRSAGDPTTPPALTIDDVQLGLDPDRPTAPPGDQPPAVELSYPEWTEGSFELTVPTADTLVTNSVTGGPLSLTGANTASAMVELTHSGAALIHKILTHPDGTGAADLLPISLRMDLKFMARVPPVIMDISADSRSVYQTLKTIDHDFDENGCRTDDIAHYETSLEMAVESQLIDVKFDTGSLPMDDDLIKEIRGTAMGLVEDLLKDKFTEPAAPDADTTGDDLVNSTTDYYILKQESQVDFSRIHYREQMTSILEAEKHPQGTLQGFFAGKTAAEMSAFVREVDLQDDFFSSLGLTVKCYADYENTPLAFVEVQLRYVGIDENGERVVKPQTLTFDASKDTDSWDPSLIGSNRTYFSRWRVGYTGQEAGEFTDWEEQITPVLNITVPNTGQVDVKVLAGKIDFEQLVDQVHVDITYEDRSSGVDEISETYRITKGEQEFGFKHDIFTEPDQPVRWSAKFFLKDGQVIETPEATEESSTLMVNAPLFDKLDVGLVPVGKGWEGVEQTIIDLFYEDAANSYVVDKAFAIKTKGEFKTWSVVLQDRDLRNFRYKVTTSFKNGRHESTDFIDMEGDQSVSIAVDTQPSLDVTIMPNMVDYQATPVVTCTMRYEDADNGITDVQTFAFDEATKDRVSWSVDLADDSPKTYSRELTYHTFHGTIEREAEVTDETVFTVPRVAVPELRCVVNAKQVDFIDTPLVVVQFDYIDDVNGHDTSEILTLENGADRPVFQHNIDEDSPREFTATVTYHLSTGETETLEPETQSAKTFIVDKRIVPEVDSPAPVPVDPAPEPVG